MSTPKSSIPLSGYTVVVHAHHEPPYPPVFVEKTHRAPDQKLADRLLRSAWLQQTAPKSAYAYAPRIHFLMFTDDPHKYRTSFRMDYVAGLRPWTTVQTFQDTLRLLRHHLDAVSGDADRAGYIGSLKPIKCRLSDLGLHLRGVGEDELSAAAHRLYRELPDQMFLLAGPCHGDLALDNVLYIPTGEHVQQDHLALLDFLPSPVSSPTMDVAKLLMDCVYRVYAVRYDVPAADSAALYATFLNSGEADRLARLTNLAYVSLLQLAQFQLLRIAPYAVKTNNIALKNHILQCTRSF